MEDRRVLADTSIIIEYLRARNKTSTPFYLLAERAKIEIPAIVAAEVFYGSRTPQSIKRTFEFFESFTVHSFTLQMAARQCTVIQELLKINNMIDIRDLMIAVSALELDLPLATLNRAHFEPVPGLILEVLPAPRNS